MKTNGKLTNKEYEDLSFEYEQNPPKLSGKPGFLSDLREKKLIADLLPPEYARIINAKAKTMLLSPSEVIQYAIKEQLLGSV